jgi:hypothetical protein
MLGADPDRGAGDDQRGGQQDAHAGFLADRKQAAP